MDIEKFEIQGLEHDNFTFVDIREEIELLEYSLPKKYGVEHWPLSEYSSWKDAIQLDKKYLFICARGVRSGKLVEILLQSGYSNCFSLRGGIQELKEGRRQTM